jgi:hypothetical protein
MGRPPLRVAVEEVVVQIIRSLFAFVGGGAELEARMNVGHVSIGGHSLGEIRSGITGVNEGTF